MKTILKFLVKAILMMVMWAIILLQIFILSDLKMMAYETGFTRTSMALITLIPTITYTVIALLIIKRLNK